MNYLATLTQTYPSEEAARRAVRVVRAAGVPPRDIRLLTSRPLHDTRREPRGGFAGPVGPDALVGTYAGRVRRSSQTIGSFATGSSTGNPDRQRRGSFADVERVMIVICEIARKAWLSRGGMFGATKIRPPPRDVVPDYVDADFDPPTAAIRPADRG
jgi:hypothetical protein